MITQFDFETNKFRAYLAENLDAAVYRYPKKIVIFTGDDLPPDDMDTKFCELGIHGLRDNLKSHGHDDAVIAEWLGKYV